MKLINDDYKARYSRGTFLMQVTRILPVLNKAGLQVRKRVFLLWRIIQSSKSMLVFHMESFCCICNALVCNYLRMCRIDDRNNDNCSFF